MKKNCYWMVFVFIALIFGCAKAVIRADLPKTFPNVQILTEKLDKKEALAILDRNLLCRKPYAADRCIMTDDGFNYSYDRLIAHKSEPTYDGSTKSQGTKTTSTYRKASRVLYFKEIQRLEVTEPKSSGWYHIYFYVPERVWFEGIAGQDEVIAALLTLCPNIK